MFCVRSASALVCLLVVAGCSPVAMKQRPSPLKAACTEAAGDATMGDPAAARYYAKKSLDRSIGPARDYLASEGLRRLRVAAARVDCAPYVLASGRGGLTRCVATARICAKQHP